MNSHKNARLTPKGREAMVRSVLEGGLSKADAAYQFNTTSKTVADSPSAARQQSNRSVRDGKTPDVAGWSKLPPRE
jgi:transposase-like protein